MFRLLLMFRERTILFSLFIINFLGTIYGYWWYKEQLKITPSQFLIFVPDSPTASLFFLFVLMAFFIGRNWGLMEAFAAVTLIKYGIWAVVMNIVAGMAGSELTWQNYMLILSHGGMALQAIIYAPYFRIKPWHLIIAAVWTIHNDIIDYVFMMHPWVASSIAPSIHQIGYFTFWLSIVSIFTVYYCSVRKNSLKIELAP